MKDMCARGVSYGSSNPNQTFAILPSSVVPIQELMRKVESLSVMGMPCRTVVTVRELASKDQVGTRNHDQAHEVGYDNPIMRVEDTYIYIPRQERRKNKT